MVDRRPKKEKPIFVEHKDSVLGGPHIIHLTNVINKIVEFYYKGGKNKNEQRIYFSFLFLLR